MNAKKIISVLLIALLMLVTITGCAGDADNAGTQPQTDSSSAIESDGDMAEETVSVALLLPGPINDGGWNTSAYEGLKMLEEKYGWSISYSENISIDKQSSALRDYARQGYDFIIGHGFQFGDSLIEVASEFPDTFFAQVGGDVGGTYANLTSGNFRTGELAFVLGRMAAELTESNLIGFIGAMEIPTTVDEVETIEATVAKYNPDAKVAVAYTGTWTDVAAAKEATKAMIAKGADVIVGIADATDVGSIQACQEADSQVWYVGWAGDRYELGPDVVATSGVQSVPELILSMAERLINKQDGIAGYYGIEEGVQLIGQFGDNFPEDLKQMVLEEHQKFITGEYTRNGIMDIIGRVPEVMYDK